MAKNSVSGNGMEMCSGGKEWTTTDDKGDILSEVASWITISINWEILLRILGWREIDTRNKSVKKFGLKTIL